MKSYSYGRRNNNKNIIIIFTLSITFLAILFFTMSDIDRDAPSISLKHDEIYVGKNKNIEIKLKDNVDIRKYKVVLTDGNEHITLESKSDVFKKEVIIDVEFPKIDLFFKKDNAILTIEARDSSLWNFFMGNKITREVPLIFDDTLPDVRIISTSKSIRKGGSAVVVFSLKEDNPHEVYVSLGGGLKFKPTKFYKGDNYASLIVWDVKVNNINPSVIAIDKAGNKAMIPIPINKKFSIYKKSKIKLKNNFLDKKITNLYKSLELEPANIDKIDKFVNINEKQRSLNSKLILSNATDIKEDYIDSFSLNSFTPLRRYATVGSFGVFREFSYDRLKVSESYHLGIDIASIRNDNIKTTNSGEIVFADKVGIYGNSIILYHKLGIYSLYSHCTELFFHKGNKVQKGDIIARTGQTGLAMGDHLHFSIIVQGVFARPNEWLSQKWIDDNIATTLENAKYLIDQN